MITKIEQLLKTNRKTQKQLAKYLKIPQSTISEWKSGRLKPSIDDYVLIADYFHVSLDELCGRDEFINASQDAEPRSAVYLNFVAALDGLSDGKIKELHTVLESMAGEPSTYIHDFIKKSNKN